MQAGKVIIFSAPSGAGKTTIVKHLLGLKFGLEFSISATSRQARVGETHAKDYYFLPVDVFDEKIKNNEFLEWEEVYAGTKYGTLKSEIDRIWQNGNHVIFDVDVEGGINLKKIFGNQALSIFVMPPDVDTLAKRLEERGTESPETLKKRVDKAAKEMMRAPFFDKVILNDKLEYALEEAEKLLTYFLNS